MDKTYTITLADGTQLENLGLNGSSFVSRAKVDESIFEGNLDVMTISDGETESTYENMMFVAQMERENGAAWYLVFTPKSRTQLQDEKIAALTAENKLLKAQTTAQTDRADFLEDCIAEMATLVYAD